MRHPLAQAAGLWLFDLDGTLVAQSDDQLDAWVAALREAFGLEAAPGAIAPHLGRTFAEVVRGVLGAERLPVPGHRMEAALRAYTRHVRQALSLRPSRLLPGARELLTFLRGRGRIVGIVTGNFAEEGEPKLEGVGLRGLLDFVVYSDLATPAREALVRRAVLTARLHGFRGEFADTLVVGDSVHDVESARRTGALAVGVCTGLTPHHVLAAAGPDLLAPDLAALLASLQPADAPCSRSRRSG